MKTTVYLVRHGDVYNPDQIMYERLDGFRLSDLGREQAAKLGKFLSEKHIHALYASPLQRTIETATIVASYHKDISIVRDERIIEVSTVARGQKMSYLEQKGWNFYTPTYTKQGGEKLSDVWRRMRSFFKETVRKHKGQSVVVVSHGDPIMITMIKHKGKPLRVTEIRGETYVPTAKGFMFEFEEETPVAVNPLEF